MNMENVPCVKCGFSEHLSDAVFCQNCGIQLRNYCPDDRCEVNNVDNIDYAALPSNALYCPYCGTETTFFEYLSKDNHNGNNN